MASTQSYVGMRTPFGVIVEVEARVYDPLCVVKAKDGSTGRYRLPFLVAVRDKGSQAERALETCDTA